MPYIFAWLPMQAEAGPIHLLLPSRASEPSVFHMKSLSVWMSGCWLGDKTIASLLY